MTGRRETLSRLPARHEAPKLPSSSHGLPQAGYAVADPSDTARRNDLAIKFAICSHAAMERIERDELSAILQAAPGWARVGLTMPDERLRERAADTLAATIIEKLEGSSPADANQLRLPL